MKGGCFWGLLVCDGERREREENEGGRIGEEERPWWLDAVVGGVWHRG